MKNILVLLFIGLSSCAFSSRKPKQPPVVPTPVPMPTPVPTPIPARSVNDLLAIAGASRCTNVSWSQRGSAPKGYTKGMALAYAKAVCRVRDADDGFGQIMNQPLKNSNVDALSHYGLPAGIKSLYTLEIGLGMRESSGKYCEGRDTSASNTSSNTAEAGMMQSSYDSAGAHRLLPSLMAYYQANPSKCQLNVFKEGVSCRATSNYGSGQGLAFQKLAKSCPMFAAEWAAVTLRNLRKHYGPINRKEAQVNSNCRDMLSMIEREIEANPSVCSLL